MVQKPKYIFDTTQRTNYALGRTDNLDGKGLKMENQIDYEANQIMRHLVHENPMLQCFAQFDNYSFSFVFGLMIGEINAVFRVDPRHLICAHKDCLIADYLNYAFRQAYTAVVNKMC